MNLKSDYIRCTNCIFHIKHEMAKEEGQIWLIRYHWRVFCKKKGTIWRNPHEEDVCEIGEKASDIIQ